MKYNDLSVFCRVTRGQDKAVKVADTFLEDQLLDRAANQRLNRRSMRNRAETWPSLRREPRTSPCLTHKRLDTWSRKTRQRALRPGRWRCGENLGLRPNLGRGEGSGYMGSKHTTPAVSGAMRGVHMRYVCLGSRKNLQTTVIQWRAQLQRYSEHLNYSESVKS